jgi:nickel/cobalt transporter (NicO) family protein
MAFLYGIAHAVLPGHRKTVIMSYYLSEDASPLHGVAAGFLFAFMHALSALAIILVVFYVLDVAVGATVMRIGEIIQITSAGLIAVIGLSFLIVKIQEARKFRATSRELALNKALGMESRMVREKHQYKPRKDRFLPLVISSGIVPCPGTTLLLLFALSLGALDIGVVAVLSMSLGLGVALSAFAVATIFLKTRVVAVFESGTGHAVHIGIELLGASAICIFGVVSIILHL